MARRVLSLFLAALMLFTSLPLSVLADEAPQTDAPQEVAISNVVELQEEAPQQPPKLEKLAAFYDKAADAVAASKWPSGARLLVAGYTGGQMQFALTDDDNDKKIPLGGKTAETIRLFAVDSNYAPLCEAIDVSLTQETYKVEFYDGEDLFDTYYVTQGEAMEALPDAGDKVGYTFVGYFTDEACTDPFYDGDPVNQNLKVYAAYEVMEELQQPEGTAYALIDSKPDISFDIEKVSGHVDPEDAATLLIIDGSDPVDLSIRENNDGTYTVFAPAGFNEGCSYQLELADGWNFKDKHEKVRTASFSIFMEEVENLQMNDAIIYIQDTDDISYSVGSETHPVLNSVTLTENGGTFEYSGDIKVGDLLCIYVGDHPEQRKTAKEMMDPAMYVTVSAYDNGTVTYVPLADENRSQLFNIPDNFPIRVTSLPNGAGTVNLDDLSIDVYEMLLGEEGTEAHALENIAEGDFVTLFVGDGTDPEDVCYGQIESYDAETGEIGFKQVTRDAIRGSMDLYMNLPLSGTDMVTDEEAREIETILLQQVEESGFAEEAAWALADIVTKTDGFEDEITLQEFLATDENGNEIELMNLGGKWELTDDVELSVELIREGDQLHFTDKGTVQLAIGVDAEFEVDLEDGAKIKIELGATFVEEVGIDPRVKAKPIYEDWGLFDAIVGVRADAAVDVWNYTAFSFEAKIYTVEAKDEDTWTKLKNLAQGDLSDLEIGKVNPTLLKGLNTIGDVMDKIDSLEAELKKLKETNEKYEGYVEDIAALVELVGSDRRTEWKAWAEELDQSNVTSELLEMKNLTNETELGTDYHASMEALMDRYSEMINQKSAWVELVNKHIFGFELNYCGLILGVDTSFVVRADLSLAVGSNLEYEVGKRFSFWFEIHGFKSDSGSGTMDLIDEHFGFQFYAMGRLGLKAGIRGKIYVALGSAKFASIGIAVELGPYLKMYGFFLYTYERTRPVGSNRWNVESEMAGAVFIEIGVYFLLEVEANAIGDLVEWNKTLINKETPLVEIGGKKFYYDFVSEPELLTEPIRVVNPYTTEDNKYYLRLPISDREMKYIDLTTGIKDQELPKTSDIRYTLSSSAYQFDPETGVITVTVPEGVRYIACNLTMTYRRGKAAFSSRDLSVTIPLVWHDLTKEELDPERKIAVKVRAGCEEYGYQTIQTEMVYPGTQISTDGLPDAAAIVAALGEKDPTAPYRYLQYGHKYQNVTQDMVINEETVLYCDLQRQIHRISVEYVNAGTSTGSKIYSTYFDEPFDFSILEYSGANGDGIYRKFVGVEWDMEALETMGLTEEPFDLDEPIDTVEKVQLLSQMYAANLRPVNAIFEDNGATATFRFVGWEREVETQIVQKGTSPDLNEIAELVSDNGMYIARVTPAVGKINSNTTYEVICKTASETAVKANVTFNDGNSTKTASYVVGSVLPLPTPTRAGYGFAGWYTDEALKQPCKATTVPNGGLTLYAKWTGLTYPMYYNDRCVGEATCGQPYGELPELPKNPDYAQGWIVDGQTITSDTIVSASGPITLRIGKKLLKTIELDAEDIYTYYSASKALQYTGEPKTPKECDPRYDGTDLYSVEESDFVIRYRMQGEENCIEGYPVNAGTYDAVITRAQDSYRAQDCYRAFEAVYEGAVRVAPGTLPFPADALEVVELGMFSAKIKLSDSFLEQIGPNAVVTFTCQAPWIEQTVKAGAVVELTGLYSGQSHTITVTVDPKNPNYKVDSSQTFEVETLKAATEYWEDAYSKTWYEDVLNNYANTTEFTISTPEELAAMACLSKDFMGKTVILTQDLDMSGRIWAPLGIFSGTFDGGGHTISNVYVSSGSSSGVGLFGSVTNNNTTPAVIKNLTLKDSYILGKYKEVGGLIGKAGAATIRNCVVENVTIDAAPGGGISSVGGIVGGITSTSAVLTIENCVSNVMIRQSGTRKNDRLYASGGILGGQSDVGSTVTIRNCASYGTVMSSLTYNVGGISGHMKNGSIVNCVNFADVIGQEPNFATWGIGGILGDTDSTSGTVRLYNNYNLGQVHVYNPNKSTVVPKIGAIISAKGRGAINGNYYLQDCAQLETSTGELTTFNAVGTVEDSTYNCASFTSPKSLLTTSGKDLISTLNNWVASESNTYNAVQWVVGSDGYPIPTGLPQ